MGIVALDRFNRADSATLGVAESGQSWINVSGTWGITGNQAKLTTAATQAQAVLDLGISNVSLYLTFGNTPQGGAAGGGGLSWRVVDANNLWFWDVSDASVSTVYYRSGGVLTSINTFTGFAAGDVMSMHLSGTSFIGEKNGSALWSYTASLHQSATQHGIRDYGGNTLLDHFVALAPGYSFGVTY